MIFIFIKKLILLFNKIVFQVVIPLSNINYLNILVKQNKVCLKINLLKLTGILYTLKVQGIFLLH